VARKTVVRHRDIIVASSLAVLIIATTVLVQVMMIMPSNSRADSARQRLSETIKKLEENNRKGLQLADLEDKNAKDRQLLQVFDDRMISRNRVTALFSEVLRSANRSKLKIIYTHPNESISIGQGFYRFPYDLELQGEYHAIARFFSGIESHTNFMQVVRADMTKSTDSTVRMKVLVYLYASVEKDQFVEGAKGDKEALTGEASSNDADKS